MTPDVGTSLRSREVYRRALRNFFLTGNLLPTDTLRAMLADPLTPDPAPDVADFVRLLAYEANRPIVAQLALLRPCIWMMSE